MSETLSMGTTTHTGDGAVEGSAVEGSAVESSAVDEAANDARFRDAARLIAEGRQATATLIYRETSERRYRGVQIVIGTFEIDDPLADSDGEPQTVIYEHIFGPASARKWRPGRQVDVWIDPDDPDNIYVGR
jgi:hypothetical protein